MTDEKRLTLQTRSREVDFSVDGDNELMVEVQSDCRECSCAYTYLTKAQGLELLDLLKRWLS